MATKFAAREVLVLATEDDCSGGSNSENSEGYVLAQCGMFMCLLGVGEAIPGPRPCRFSTKRISRVAENELQEEDRLGKQSFVPKAILHC